MSAAENKAVFLSYASQDAEAAKRICEALRAAGVEVWFDQNELVGGDAWDQKIRRQIKECALFVPVISANTQARLEGYFRLEWKLAAQRTHTMAEEKAFLLPVVIDSTSDAVAIVPAEFKAVQWTRLQGALPTPQFAAQIVGLLVARDMPLEAGRTQPVHVERGGFVAAPAKPKTSVMLALAVAGLLIIGIGTWQVWRQPASESKSGPRQEGAEASTHPRSPGIVAGEKSLAVLPFANLGTDRENEAFADGMHDDVITALSKIHDLKVISRTSVMAYKAGTRNLKQIAAELGVGNVLEGSVRRDGGRVRLNVQLIDAHTDGHLWAENYTEDLSDVFAVQSRLAEAITRELRAQFSPAERSLIARRVTANPEAYELYQRARRVMEEMGVVGSRAQNDAIVEFLERAVAKDPAFALGYAQLAAAHSRIYWFGGLDPTAERRRRTQTALEAAERLAPGAPEIILARGRFEYRCNNAWAQSLVHFRAAEKNLPNDANLQSDIAAAHRRLGQWADALVAFQRAAALNPRDLGVISSLAETLFCMRRYAEVEEVAHRHLLGISDPVALSGLGTYLAIARFALNDDAIAYAAKMREVELPSDGYPIGYEVALDVGDSAAAEAALATAGVVRVLGANRMIDDPVALHRATLAWLRGDRDAARKLAEEGLHYYDRRSWNYRQEAVVAMGRARAHALAGRTTEATALAEATVRLQAERDSYALSEVVLQAAWVYVVAGDREKAFEYFRRACSSPGFFFSASQLRRNPLWTALRNDPRFEEILRTMKPL